MTIVTVVTVVTVPPPTPTEVAMMRSSSDDTVPLVGGPVLPAAVIRWLVGLADRGITVARLPDGRVSIVPLSALTEADRAFARAHRDDLRAAVDYLERGCACTCDLAPGACPWHRRGGSDVGG